MQQAENYYSMLGVTKASTDMDIRQAYNVQVESLRAKTTPQTQAQAQQRLELLDLALQTLLNPEKRKRHDEKLDWFVARARLQADRAQEAAIRLKQAQDDAEQARQAALAAEKDAAKEAARRADAEAKRQAELARVETEAAERFRRLREERLPFMDTAPPPLQDDENPTRPLELTPEPSPPVNPEAANQYLRSVGIKAALGSAALLVFFWLAYSLLKPGAPPKPASLVTQPMQDSLVAVAAGPDVAASAAAPTVSPNSSAPVPALTAQSAKVAKAESANAAELQQYQKVLRRVEQEHPELNPDRAGHRDDLIAYVAARTKVHQQAGYPRSRALDIAVRDMEMQEQAKRMLEKYRSKDPTQAQTAPVLDKGEHQGYDPKCRWVTPEQWSCK